jgi:hypothetical protein
MKLTKKNVLVISMLTTALLLVWQYAMSTFGLCRVGGIYNFSCYDISNFIQFSFFPASAFVFIFSLVIFWMKEEVFKAWYKVASWFVPVIILTTIYLNATSSTGGFFNMDKEINFLILLILYSIFVITSIWKIVTTYRKTKNN